MLDDYLLLASVDEASVYCQYIQECCPLVDLEFLDDLDIDIFETNWEEPASAFDFNNVAVIALIKAENTDDLVEHSLYLEYAIEALKKGKELPDGSLCKAHLAVIYSILGVFDKAMIEVYNFFFDILKYDNYAQNKLQLGLVYLPHHTEKWSITCQDRIPEILQSDNGNKQALAILMEVFYQSNPNFNPTSFTVQDKKHLQDSESTTYNSKTEHNIQTLQSCKIVMVVSGGLKEFIENTLISIRNCNIDLANVEIFTPKNIKIELEYLQLKYGLGRITSIEDISNQQSSLKENDDYHDYGTADFGRFTIYKWIAIKSVLDRGIHNVIYTDVDIAWRCNPLELLQKINRTYDIASQTDGESCFPPDFCTGFMSFANTEVSHKILNFLISEHIRVANENPEFHDQIVFNNFIHANMHVVKYIFPLSEVIFPTGLSAKLLSTKDESLQQIQSGQPDPFIFHANWTIGLKNKKKMLQITGNWFVPE